MVTIISVYNIPVIIFDCSIDGEIVPKMGDRVKYKRLLIPPKNEKFSAVHVQIVQMNPAIPHETWEEPPRRSVSDSGTKN